MSKRKIGVISLSVFIFLIVVISAPSFSNMNDIRQIEEYAESLKEPMNSNSKSVVMVAPSIVNILRDSVNAENEVHLVPDVISTILGKNNTVTWVNHRDTPITLISNSADSTWSTALIFPGKDVSVTFNKTGIFEYHGNPSPWINGKVIVLEK